MGRSKLHLRSEWTKKGTQQSLFVFTISRNCPISCFIYTCKCNLEGALIELSHIM